MFEVQPTAPVLAVEGVIEVVDPVNRELLVADGQATVRFDVPADCPVVLNSERVKFRLLQPLDRVRVVYAFESGRRWARRIEVQTGRWIRTPPRRDVDHP